MIIHLLFLIGKPKKQPTSILEPTFSKERVLDEKLPSLTLGKQEIINIKKILYASYY